MAAAMNGMALHGGFIPYGGTFLVFSDYARRADPARGADAPARRLRDDARLHRARRGRPDAPAGRASGDAARHAEPLRVPPADAVETAEAWEMAACRDGHAVRLALSRQNLPVAARRAVAENLSAAGAYVLREATAPRDVTMPRDRLGDRDRAGRPPSARGGGHRGRRRLHALLGALRGAGRGLSAPRCSAPRRASPSRPPRGSAGTAGSARRPLHRHDLLRRLRPRADVYEHFGITVDAAVNAAKTLVHKG